MPLIQNLVATTISPASIRLNWTCPKRDRSKTVSVLRSEELGAFIEIASIKYGLNTFTSIGLKSNTKYSYKLMLNSNYSNVASAITQDVQLNAPTNLTASALSTSAIQLNWTNNNGNVESSVGIERSLSNAGPFTQIATVVKVSGVVPTSYQNTGLAANTQYFYRIRALA